MKQAKMIVPYSNYEVGETVRGASAEAMLKAGYAVDTTPVPAAKPTAAKKKKEK